MLFDRYQNIIVMKLFYYINLNFTVMNTELLIGLWLLLALLSGTTVYFVEMDRSFRKNAYSKWKDGVKKGDGKYLRIAMALMEAVLFAGLAMVYLAEMKAFDVLGAVVIGIYMQAFCKHLRRRNFLLSLFWLISPFCCLVYNLSGEGYWLGVIVIQSILYMGYVAYKWFFHATKPIHN